MQPPFYRRIQRAYGRMQGMQPACRAATLCITASTPTMTHCNPMESAPLTGARNLHTTIYRLHTVVCRLRAGCIHS